MDYLVDLLLSLYGPMPYVIVFLILLACGFGVPIPEDITLFAGGLMAYYGVSDVWIMILVGFLGVMVGDSLIFLLGAKYGRALTRRWLFAKLLPPERLNEVAQKINAGGNRFLFLARFMPGLRSAVFFSAGTLHVPFRVFFFYDGLAALLSVPAIVYSVYFFGDELDSVIRIIKKIEGGIVIVIFGLILFFGAKWFLKKRRATR